MSGVALAVAEVVVTVLLAVFAYRRGSGRGQGFLPTDVVEELADHKLRCLAEPPERVKLELCLLLGVKRLPGPPR